MPPPGQKMQSVGPKEGYNFFFRKTTFFLLPKTRRDNYTIGKLDSRGNLKELGLVKPEEVRVRVEMMG